jgi:hypothetical protein
MCVLIEMVLLLSFLAPIAPLTVPANAAEPAEKVSEIAQSTAPAPAAVKQARWSTRKKILVAVAVGCIVATAIAVPVSVGAHHRSVVRRQSRQKHLAESIIFNQEIVASKQEQAIVSLLNQGPVASAAQASILRATHGSILSSTQLSDLPAAFARIKQKEYYLNSAFHHATPADTIYPFNNYTLEYDGFSDFPRYPINVLSAFYRH